MFLSPSTVKPGDAEYRAIDPQLVEVIGDSWHPSISSGCPHSITVDNDKNTLNTSAMLLKAAAIRDCYIRTYYTESQRGSHRECQFTPNEAY